MSVVSSLPGTLAVTRSWQREGAIWPTFAITLAAAFLMALPNLPDPLIRHDDYPAYFAEPLRFWSKTLHEGRWINYIWHLREIVTPSWLNFALYQACWAIVAACLGLVAMGRDGSRWYATVLALLVLVAPPATLISLWFNTQLLGLSLIALYAVLALSLSKKAHRGLLPLFVTFTFMTHSTYPLILLAFCLAGSQERSAKDLTGLLTLFFGSMVLALLVPSALNWQVHGHFGILPATWREGTPASDLAGLLANLPTLVESLQIFLARSSFGFKPAVYYHLALLFAATVVLLRRAPGEAFYHHAGLWLGMAMMVTQILKLGIISPPRAFIFVWVFYALIVLRAAVILHGSHPLGARIARNLVLLVVCSYQLQTFRQYATLPPWQQETKAIATLAQTSEGPIYLRGSAVEMPNAKKAYIQFDHAIQERLRQLTGRHFLFCDETPVACAAVEGGSPGTIIDLDKIARKD